MKTFMAFPICSILFIVLIAIVYFLKPRIKSVENRIYKSLIICNIIGLILEILCHFAVDLIDNYYMISILILKLYVVYILIWSMLFNLYVFNTTAKIDKNDNKQVKDYFQKSKKYTLIIALSISTLILFLPIYIYNKDKIVYTYGPTTNVLIIACFLIVSGWIYKCIINYKNLKQRRYLPIILCVVVLGIVLTLQSYDRSMLIATTGHAIIVALMFFTIENPDLKVISELNKNRSLIQNVLEDKSNFLFIASNKLKTSLNEIKKLTDETNEETEKEELLTKLKEISNLSHHLIFQVENVMNISTLTNNYIKVYNTKYSPSNLFNKIELLYKNKINSNINFSVKYNNTIPNYLYGDANLLRQILISLIENSIKYTSKGYIELSVEAIVKYDMCRLVINLEDSGLGISIDKLNNLLKMDEDLTKNEIKRLETNNVDINTIKKIITKMGGYITIKSELNKGTEVNVVLDQRIENDNNDNNDNNIDNYLNNRNILIVSNDLDFVKRISKLINERGYLTENSVYANDCLDRIRLKQIFSYILIDDAIDNRAYSLLQELKKIPNFKIPIIVMLDKDREFIKEHFKDDLFDNYLLKSNLKDELDRLF